MLFQLLKLERTNLSINISHKSLTHRSLGFIFNLDILKKIDIEEIYGESLIVVLRSEKYYNEKVINYFKMNN